MLTYVETERFDIGADLGEFEYDFFIIDTDDDFSALMKHYGAIYRRFIIIRKIIINRLKPDGVYDMYSVNYYYFTVVGAKDYLKRGHA